jgi:hypothetical protein
MNESIRAIDILHDVVDKLTIGQSTTILQEFENGKRATKVTIPPLIELLRESISSSSSGAGGGSLPDERNVLDSDAAEKYDRIVSNILSAFRMATTAKPFASPEQNLRQWFIAISNAHRAGKVNDDELFKWANRWGRWERTIDDKLFPPTTLEVTSPCPLCGHRWATNSDGDSIPAIIVEYRKPQSERINSLSKSFAKCRHCETVWRGDTRLRFLVYSMDNPQHAEQAQFQDSETPESGTLISAGNSCAQNTIGGNV